MQQLKGAFVRWKDYDGFHTISQISGRLLNQYEQIKQHYLLPHKEF